MGFDRFEALMMFRKGRDGFSYHDIEGRANRKRRAWFAFGVLTREIGEDRAYCLFDAAWRLVSEEVE